MSSLETKRLSNGRLQRRAGAVVAPPSDISRVLSSNMTASINRIERLFSNKRKHAPSQPTTGTSRSGSLNKRFSNPSYLNPLGPMDPSCLPSSQSDQLFPPPSYLRPKMSKMMPRDDSAPSLSPRTAFTPTPFAVSGRSQSLADICSHVNGVTSRNNSSSVAGSSRGSSVAGMSSSSSISSAGGSRAYSYRINSSTSSMLPRPSARLRSAVQYGNRTSLQGSYRERSLPRHRAGALSDSTSTLTSSSQSSASFSRSHRESSVGTDDDLAHVAKNSLFLMERNDVSSTTLNTFRSQQSRYSAAIANSSGDASPATLHSATMHLAPIATSIRGLREPPPVPPPPMKYTLFPHSLHDGHVPLLHAARPHTDTPPPSDQEENAEVSRRLRSTKTVPQTAPAATGLLPSPMPAPPAGAAVTPEVSPKTVPQGGNSSDAGDYSQRPLLQRDSLISVVRLPSTSSSDRTSLRDSDGASIRTSDAASDGPCDRASDMKLLPPPQLRLSPRKKPRIGHRPPPLSYRHVPAEAIEPAPSSADSVLKEPNLGDFLSLGDDDIAEAEAPHAPTATASEPRSRAQSNASSIVIHNKRLSLPPLVSPDEFASPPESPVSLVVRGRHPRRRDVAPSLRPPSSQAGLQALHPPLQPPPPPPSFLTMFPSVYSASASASTVPLGRPQTPASQARMAAAFEIARIASLYNFELAYVATIWPKSGAAVSGAVPLSAPASLSRRLSRSNSQASRVSRKSNHSAHGSTSTTASVSTVIGQTDVTESLAQHGSPVSMSLHRPGWEATFLAAYGLAAVKAPYNLSTPIHAKILNAEQWFEFTETDRIHAGEFSSGYGCSFYKGHVAAAADHAGNGTDEHDASGQMTPRPVRRPSSAPSDRCQSSGGEAINRGIVFVGHRRQQCGEQAGSSQGSAATTGRLQKDELDALYRDARALVDKILEMHVKQQSQTMSDGSSNVPVLQAVSTTSTSAVSKA